MKLIDSDAQVCRLDGRLQRWCSWLSLIEVGCRGFPAQSMGNSETAHKNNWEKHVKN